MKRYWFNRHLTSPEQQNFPENRKLSAPAVSEDRLWYLYNHSDEFHGSNFLKTSHYHNVYWYAKYGRWMAQITHDGKKHFIGRYDTEIEAAEAYDDYVLENELDRPLNIERLT